MSISFVSNGGLVQGADTVTVPRPSSPTAGQLLVLAVASGHPDESIPSTPSGWTLAGTLSGGGGTFGSGTGPRRLTWFLREATGGDANPVTSIPSGASGSFIAGRMYVLSRSAGTGWRWAVSAGEDTTSSTTFTAVGSPALTWAVGDFIALGYAANVNTAMASESASITGITTSSFNERADDGVTTGNTGRLAVATGSVTAGSGTQAPSVTATLSANAVGVVGALRIREASSDINATPQSVFPPRNLVAATGLAADDIVTATLYREEGDNLVPVRAASGIDVTGANDLLRVDAEQPFGVAVAYAADLVDVNGNVWRVFSGPITSTVDSDVISDAVRGIGAAVIIQTWPDKKRDRDATVFNVGGRLVAVSRPRSSAQATVTVRTMTDADGDALQEVLDGATEGVLLIRKQVSLPGVDNYLAVLSDSENRTWYNPIRYWALDTIETEPWPDVLEAAGFTLQDIADNYSTLSDLAADFATLLAIALYDFGS
ncbi:hypothetical protein ACWDWT_30965 [Streptomyces sp. NPDC003343]